MKTLQVAMCSLVIIAVAALLWPKQPKQFHYFLYYTVPTTDGSREGWRVIEWGAPLQKARDFELLEHLLTLNVTNRTGPIILKSITPL